MRLAAAVEFMHTATLLHDDVVDESDYRRGKASARLVWGNQASVLVGDFLLGQAFRMMVDVGSLGALKILSNAAAVIAEGEVMQLAAAIVSMGRSRLPPDSIKWWARLGISSTSETALSRMMRLTACMSAATISSSGLRPSAGSRASSNGTTTPTYAIPG